MGRRSRRELVALDLREYTNGGFLFTPDVLYSGRYEALGLLWVTMAAEGNLIAPRRTAEPYWEWQPLNFQDALREAQHRVIEMGGNALVNFKLETQPGANGRPTFVVSGFAIKRLDVPK